MTENKLGTSFPERLVRKFRIKPNEKYNENHRANAKREADGSITPGIGRRTYDAARFWAKSDDEPKRRRFFINTDESAV